MQNTGRSADPAARLKFRQRITEKKEDQKMIYPEILSYSGFGPAVKQGSVDLSGYARNYVADFDKVTALPRQNIAYLQALSVYKVKITSLHAAFQECGALTALDLSFLDTSDVEDMSSMFDGCSDLTSLNVSGFDTANVADMSGMFEGCPGGDRMEMEDKE